MIYSEFRVTEKRWSTLEINSHKSAFVLELYFDSLPKFH